MELNSYDFNEILTGFKEFENEKRLDIINQKFDFENFKITYNKLRIKRIASTLALFSITAVILMISAGNLFWVFLTMILPIIVFAILYFGFGKSFITEQVKKILNQIEDSLILVRNIISKL